MKTTLTLIKERLEVPQKFSASAEAEEHRNELVLASRKVLAVTDQNSQIQAGNCAREIRRWIKEVEQMRMKLTKPFLDAQRLLKGLADDHVGPLLLELERLERLATDFQEAEARRVAIEKERQRKEFERLEAIRIEAEIKVRAEAERLRLETEAAEAKAKAAAEKIKNKLDLARYNQAEELRKENESIRLAELEAQAEAAKEAELAVQAQLRQPIPEAIKASGQSVRKKLCYEVLDILAVFSARPELCELTIKPSAVLACCKATDKINGLKLWEEARSTFSTR